VPRSANVPGVHGFKRDAEKLEYIKQVVRELRSDKMKLRLKISAAADVFGVGRPGKPTMRKIWSGNHISAQAVQPPAPPQLANPACFLDIVVPEGSRLFYSKKDAATCFGT